MPPVRESRKCGSRAAPYINKLPSGQRKENKALLTEILSRVWSLLESSTALEKDPVYDIIFPKYTDLKNVATRSGIVFAPSLIDMFTSTLPPPTVDFFKNLEREPEYSNQIWAVYLLMLEKRGHKPKIYIGSATNTWNGLKARFVQYANDLSVPVGVREALDNGFVVAYQRLLCWAPMPWDDKLRVFETRLLFLSLEAIFSLLFWVVKGCKKTSYCLWETTSFDYTGCCTHIATLEPIKGVRGAMSESQLRDIADQRKLVADAKRRARLEAFRQSGGKARASKKCRTVAMEQKLHSCPACDLACQSRSALRRMHNETRGHKKRIHKVAQELVRRGVFRNGVETERMLNDVAMQGAMNMKNLSEQEITRSRQAHEEFERFVALSRA